MIVKNVTGGKALFNIGRFSAELASEALWPLPDADIKTFRDARRYEELGYIEIIEAPNFKQTLSSRSTPAWGTVTFADIGVAGKVITVAGQKYELDDDATVAFGNIGVTVGAAAADTATAFAAAVNANTASLVKASAVGAVVYLTHKTNGVDGSSVSLAVEAAADVTVSGATLSNGTYGASFSSLVVSANATAAGTATIVTGLADVSHYLVQVRDGTTGVVTPFSGTVTFYPNVTVVSAATPALTEDDVVTLVILG